MAKIQINEFKGIMPKLANDKLPADMAQVAQDLKTASLELKAFRRSTGDAVLPSTAYKTFFQYVEGANSNWVYTNSIVHWARAPVADDSFERMYYTGESGEYRAFTNDIDSSPWDFTTDYYLPGASAGVVPTLVKTGSGAVVRSYFYSFVSRYGEEGPGSAIAEMTDWLSGRVEVNDITRPGAADEHLITAVGGNYPTIRVYRTDSDASSALFQEVCEAYWFDDAQVYVAGDWVFSLGAGATWDLYEVTVGGVGTFAGGTHTLVKGELQTVADLGDTPDSYLWRRAPDNLTNLRSHPNGFFVASYGKKLYFSEPFAPWAWPEDYEIPIDANIIGLGIFGSTIVVATDANIYTFSGPHPDSLHKQRLAFQPCLSQQGLVETDLGVMFPSAEGFQLVAADSAPSNVTADWFKPEDWENFELETMTGVWYNKAYYGWFKSVDFEGGIIIDFINNSITTSMDYHHAGQVSIVDGVFRTIYPSQIDEAGVLYIAKWDASETAFRNFTYKSPRYILEKPANFKVAQVIIDTDFYNEVIVEGAVDLTSLNQDAWDETDWGYQLGGPINDYMVNAQDVNGDDLFSLSSLGIQSYIEFNVYVDSVLKFSKQVTDSNMFKLPRGFKDKKWEIEVKGMLPVKRITMATSTEEIV